MAKKKPIRPSRFDDFIHARKWWEIVLLIIFCSITYYFTTSLNWKWIFIKALVPIFGPTILHITVFSGRLIASPRNGGIWKNIPFRRTLMPSVWFVYTIVATLDALYAISFENETKNTGLLWTNGLVLFVCIVVYIPIIYRKGLPDSEASSALLWTTFLLALGAAALGYVTFAR